MRWRVEDFKGLRSADLDLREGRLTVLTGVNSSGKSSVLQSLLLMAQSMYSGGRVVLNGALVRLGEADDLVRERAGSKQVTFEFGIESDSIDLDVEGDYDVSLGMSPTDDNMALQPRHVTLVRRDALEQPLVLDKQNARKSDVETARRALEREGKLEFLHVKSCLGAEPRPLRTYVAFRGFVPVELIQLDSADQIARRYRHDLELFLYSELEERFAKSSTSTQRTSVFSPVLREFVRLLDWSVSGDASEVQGHLQKLLRVRAGNPYTFVDAWASLSRDEREEAVNLAVEQRRRSPFVRVTLPEPYAPPYREIGLLELALEQRLRESVKALAAAGQQLYETSDRIRYLGPLRDEPRVVWNQWNEVARGLPVGTRGEFSASVLSRSASRSTSYTAPDGRPRNATLLEAVNEWLAYLEIGQEVEAKSLGKLGVGLRIAIDGSSRDLTSVGVGVSQALPLVVAILSIPAEAIFIVEQPELHLHPAVQARLADFLVRARPDITTIVETHSDAFVTRLRRRVAEGSVETEKIAIVFVEPGQEGAVTEELGLSAFGDLDVWPRGFLNAAEEDTSAIIKANVKRMTGGQRP